MSLESTHCDDVLLATLYDNIGVIYRHQHNYDFTLENYSKCLKIRKKFLPDDHPKFAGTLMNIGTAYSNKNEQTIALSYMQKALDIELKSLPCNHIELGSSYNNIGLVYTLTNELKLALRHVRLANKNFRINLPSGHPRIIDTDDTIERIPKHMQTHRSFQQTNSVQNIVKSVSVVIV
ncbi:hypothetical protein I4U23_004547 [Adineta vaga]|nr:hypothetical protein I4U23_004547 [Adineta vaga]